MEGKATICGMDTTADQKEVTGLPPYSGSFLSQSFFG